MDNINNPKKQLIFPENIDETIDNLLRKYNLEETEDETLNKLESGLDLSGEIVMDIAKKLFYGSTKENELTLLIKNKLNLPKESAGALISDIKQQILPLIKEELVPEEQNQESPITKDNELSFVKISPVISVEKNEKILEKSRESVREVVVDENPMGGVKKIKKTFPPDKIAESVPQPRQQRGPDNYREPIE